MIKPLIFDSYITVIKNSLGANTYRNFYAEVDGVKKDILENGNLSCAIFVSNILNMFGLIKGPHVTVISTVKDIESFGWVKIDDLKVGAVVLWESVDFGATGFHTHLGFYMGEDKAISNSPQLGHPIEHHYTFGDTRKIDAIYWHPKLD